MKPIVPIGVLLVVAVAAAANARSPAARLRLEVLLVNDADFPPVTKKDARVILDEARATLSDKLAFKNISFVVTGTTTVKEFLDASVALDAGSADACQPLLEPQRVRPGGPMPGDVPKHVVMKFLNRWDLEELKAFFPKRQQLDLDTYDDIYLALTEEFHKKLEAIAGYQLKDGKALLAPDRVDQRSYVRWICAVRNQNRADLILTNAFLLYDLGSEPYPHAIFAKNKVGGASLYNRHRAAIKHRAVVASTFSIVTDIPFFREQGIDTLSAADRLKLIGTFIVAHELGHAVFKLPDFYDHPKECLMTTKYETGYVSGYATIKKYPGACSFCQPYVDAKRHIFAARLSGKRGRHGAAIESLKLAIRQTPKHIDGSYLGYIAELSVEIAATYLKAGKTQEARRWVHSTLRIAPKHSAALGLRRKLDTLP